MPASFVRHWPVLLGIALWILVSVVVEANEAVLQSLFASAPAGLAVVLFILLGILLVMIPGATILPLMPLAVTLWGWPVTALLTLTAWVIGGQILFELARAFGKPLVARVIAPGKLAVIARLMHGGMVHSILVRTVVHGDIISYAFGLFSDVGRLQYLVVSAIGVAPAAFMYAYFGSLPLTYQIAMMAGAALMLAGLALMKMKKPSLTAMLETSAVA